MTSPTDKNIIMCATTGRSGTNLLEKLFALADDTHSLHEPSPAFQSVLPEVRKDPAVAVAFVRDQKLPAINAIAEKNYAETSHLFGKGFFEAFVQLGVPFRLVILNRDPSEVAQSLWRIKTVPHRTKSGDRFLFDPAQTGVLPLSGWRWKTDYQLCYWYCLEVERRKTIYAQECAARGIPFVEISLTELKDWEKFQALCRTCGLTLPADAREKHAAITADRVNRKEKHGPRLNLLPFSFQEERVWKALGEDGVALRADIARRYARQA